MSNKQKFYETCEFSKLNDEWKVKLQDSGFNDIENETGYEDANSEISLLLDNVVNTRSTTYKTLQQTQEYYSLVGSYLHTGTFKNDRIRKIWEMHSEGFSLGEISDKVGLHKTTVFFHVKKHLKKAKGL